MIFRYDDAVIRDLEDDLIHMWEFMPSDSACQECQRIKASTWALCKARAKELGSGKPHEDGCGCRRCTLTRAGVDVGTC